MNTELELLHSRLTQVSRHGWAIVSGETIIGWSISLKDAIVAPNATKVVNVQNGGTYIIENGEVVESINGVTGDLVIIRHAESETTLF